MNNSPTPLVTIGITCFNAEDTIERAVQSALDQEWPSVEIVIVDDCSTDGSWQILTRLQARHRDVRLLRKEVNSGYPAALNTIVEAARGEFVAFFDDDDDNASRRLHCQYDRIVGYERRTGAELVLCYSDRNIVRSGHESSDHVARAIGRVPEEPFGPVVADYVLGISSDTRFVWGMFGSCTLMARKSTFRAIGPFDESFRRCAELDMAIRGAFSDAHFVAVDTPLVTQYKTATSDKAGKLPLRYAMQLRKKYRSYLKRKRAYLASCAIAYSNFYGNTRQVWRSRFFRIGAFLLRPRLLPFFLGRRRERRLQ